MTFAIAGRCDKTGRLGVAISTRPMAVGGRCACIVPNVGIAVCMAYTDPRLSMLGGSLLTAGYSAPKVLQEMAASDVNIEYRQICTVDRDGNAAARTGRNNKVWSGHHTAHNVVAMGNRLTSQNTVEAMRKAWEDHGDSDLDERLLASIEAGRDAGGQVGGQNSAALLVFDTRIYPYVNLRVDLNDEPIGELRRIYARYRPLIPYYYNRVDRPAEFGMDTEWLEHQEGKRAAGAGH